MKVRIIKLFICELLGTALLCTVGLSIVILIWGKGSVFTGLIPSEYLRRLVTGFFFGTTGCLISLTAIGRISGAHINPAVSFAFYLRGKMKLNTLSIYLSAQIIGAALGSIPLLFWKDKGNSVGYGKTVPGDYGFPWAFTGELITTGALVLTIFIFVGSKKLRRFTPFTMPLLFGTMVCLESPLSGCSTNLARSFGPALVSGDFTGFWIYIIAPFAGVVIMTVIFKLFRLHEYYKIESARISYHNHPAPAGTKKQ